MEKKSVGLNPRIWEPMPLLGQALFITTANHSGVPQVEAITQVVRLGDEPPLLGIFLSPQTGSATSLRHLKKMNELVVNVPQNELAEQFYLCRDNRYQEVERIERLGFRLEPSSKVAPPRLAECLANLECRVTQRQPLAGGTLFVVEVVHAAFSRELRYGTLRQRAKELAPFFWFSNDGESYCEAKLPKSVAKSLRGGKGGSVKSVRG